MHTTLLLGLALRPDLVDTAQQLAQMWRTRAAEHDAEASFPFSNITEAREAGLLALAVPQEHGGLGASLLETVVVLEHLAQGDGPTALVLAMQQHILGGVAESGAWPTAAFERVCRAVVEQGALLNSAASEREMGSPSRGGTFATVAHKTEQGWSISGRKIFTTGAPALTHVLVSAALDEGDGPQLTNGVFLVETAQAGVQVEPTWNGTAMRAARNDDLIFEDVQVAEADLLLRREPGAADATKGSGSTWFQLTMAGVYLGVAQAACDAAIAYACERRPTALAGRSISELESIQRRLGQNEAELAQARALVYHVAQAWQAAPEARTQIKPYVGLAKAQATENAVRAVDGALLVAGGSSLQPELPLARLMRDVRAGLFHPPTLDAALVGLGKALVESA